MALISAVAGPYTSTFDPPGATAAATLGIMEQGYELSIRRLADPIEQTDAYGKTPLDAVYQGMSCKLSGVGLEYAQASLLAALFPQHATEFTSGANKLRLGQPGILDSSRWGTLVLTAVAGTSAAAAPATLTATGNTILSPNFDVKWLMGPVHRKIPWEFQLFPYTSTDVVFFVTT